MVKYLCTGAAVAALLVTPIAAPAVDLSLTSIYQGTPSVVAATGWALAGPQSTAKNRRASSTGAGYIMLTCWSLKGEYDYVNLLDPGVADTPASTTIAKTGMPAEPLHVKGWRELRFLSCARYPWRSRGRAIQATERLSDCRESY